MVASPEMSRRVRFPSLLLVLALGLSSLACVPHYQVIAKSGPPSALVGLGAVWVQYDYSHVAISDKRMSEEQWLASRENITRAVACDGHATTAAYMPSSHSVKLTVTWIAPAGA